MAGIQKGSSDNLTSPIPHLLNADFLTATARLAAGQIHYAGRDYYQRDTDTHYRLRSLSWCFAADGTTPATFPGTWGTLEAHWVVGATAGTNGTNGVNGNRVLALAGAPVLSDGNLADLAIVTTVGDLYEKTSSGWALRGNLKGPAGTGGTGTGTSAGVSTFNTRSGTVTLTAADVLSVVNSSNQLIGGLHNATTKVSMLAIPAALRDYGMTVIVYLDPVTSNNGRYDLSFDLQTWIKQGIDLASQFQPYNAALLYNTSSAYVTYPDSVSAALRIFHSVALTAPAMQPAPLSSTNVLSTSWEEISPATAAAARIPLYTATGQSTDGPMTQKAATDAIVAPIIGRTPSGVRTIYATAQLAAAALATTGGVIFSEVDILGPLVLQGAVSLIAPGRRVYLSDTSSNDTLTLNACTGVIEVAEISRDTAGTGYALVINGGTIAIKANRIITTQGYNAIFNNGGSLVYRGNAELVNNTGLGVVGERIVVLATANATLQMRGNITLTSADTTIVAEGLTCFVGSNIDYEGIITVVNKGRIARNQGGTMIMRGVGRSADKGIFLFNAKTDLFFSIDTRTAPATADATPLLVGFNALNVASNYTLLHISAELLAPTGIASISNYNIPAGFYTVQVVGVLVQNNAPGPAISLQYLTPGAGKGTIPWTSTATFGFPDTATYDTPTGYAGGNRLFRWNLPGDTTQLVRVAPLTATNTLQGSWTEISAALAGGTGGAATILYAGTGVNQDGPMTQVATTAALALKADLVAGLVPTTQLPNFTTLTAAQIAGLNANASIAAANSVATQADIANALVYANTDTAGNRNIMATGAGFVPAVATDSSSIDNFFAVTYPSNTYASGQVNNRFGYLGSNNKFGAGMKHCVFGAFLKNSTFGINLISCRVGDNCQAITIGDNCQRVEVYNSNTLTIPPNTVDAVYRNNALVVAGGTYTAGTGIAISGTNVISATGTPATTATAGIAKLYTATGTATDGAMTQAATTAALFFDFTNEAFTGGSGPFSLAARTSNIVSGNNTAVTYNLPTATPATYLGIRLQAAPVENLPLAMVFAGGTLDNQTTLTMQPGDFRIISKPAGSTVWNTVWFGRSATSPATATTAGVVKIGSGVTVAADGTISVAAPTGNSTGGVFRGPWSTSAAYAQYDYTFIPAGFPNAGLMAYALSGYPPASSYVPGNWSLDAGQSTNDYTSPEKAKLAGLATVATSGAYADLIGKPAGSVAGGVFRGAFAAVAYAQYDCIIIPAGQPNAGLFAYASTAFTATATYTATNWTLDPGQSTNDYTAAAVARLGVGVALATAATDLSSAINEVRNLLVNTVERTGAYTVALTDAGNLIPVNSATAVAVTVPPNSSVAFLTGTVINFSQVAAGQIVITAGAGVTIRQADAQLKSAKQWAEISLRKRGPDEWVLSGYTAA